MRLDAPDAHFVVADVPLLFVVLLARGGRAFGTLSAVGLCQNSTLLATLRMSPNVQLSILPGLQLLLLSRQSSTP